MLTIPETYLKNNEDYITIPAIRAFMHQHSDGKFKLSQPREKLLSDILEYGNKSEKNKEAVLSWIDSVLQEGIKDVYLQYAPLSESMALLLSSEAGILKHVKSYQNIGIDPHICMNRYGKEYTRVSMRYTNDERYGPRITFVYCRKLYTHDKDNNRTRPIDYPVIADYFIESQWLLVRAKPRSNLYLFGADPFILEEATKTSTEKEIRIVVTQVEQILRFETADRNSTIQVLKNRVFNLLAAYTHTPSEIVNVMVAQEEKLQSLSKAIQDICTIPGICEVPETMIDDIRENITNILEKYLSINWKDKRAFTQDRPAYPVKLSATDEEESQVSQTAAMAEPLQTKAIFFDNKKMLYKSQSCDSVTFQWYRANPISGLKASFPVRIEVTTRGQCVFKFSEYTEKEDIENVIFSVIRNQRAGE